ncbi:N-alkane-inducible cytochrome P450 [Talaromyces proteolyticus]|uniref:N-alkane-inducible cytochrome P450 n=1 Tax=Talaromyces proteolyticus TaxID=1131652 RepID=A0AAD4KS35_9EURO|nr:N-alkane-inducible cytochrome P450 [Talaromyces proteolyticus]KAH8695297.1 N-alkane-inducible cytochrome P450 [Talaromyces proteolyticus]
MQRVSEYLIFSQLKRQNGCAEPRKYPHKDPILGLDLFLESGKVMKSNSLLAFNHRLFDTYGKTFQYNSWGHIAIRTMQPENIQAVLSTSFGAFGVVPLKVKPSKNQKPESGNPLMSKGIFTADGVIWEHARSLIKPTFSKHQITNFSSLEGHFRKLLDLIPRDNSTVDLAPLLKRFILDTSTEFLFGKSVECLSPTTTFDSKQFLDAFDISMRGLGERLMLGKFSFIKGRDQPYKDAVKTVHAYIDGHVERALAEQQDHKAEKLDANERNHKGKRYILLNEMVKETQDPVELRYSLLNVFFPAHDATAVAVNNILFHLAREPKIQARLRADIMAATKSQPLSFELLKSIKYLRYIFNEGIRLHTPPNRLLRICHKDTVLPVGGGVDGKSPILVRKGTNIQLHTQAMHVDPDIWGANDAHVFRPERWETARPTWEYLPFGGGPRICPAQQMTYTESAFIIVRLFQEFKEIRSRDVEPWTEMHRMIVENKNGLKVMLVPA